MDLTIINTCKKLTEIINFVESHKLENISKEMLLIFADYISVVCNADLTIINKYNNYIYKKSINWFIIGLILEKSNNVVLAEKIYSFILEDQENKKNYQIYYHLGIVYFNQKKYNLAELEFIHGLNSNPFDIDLQLRLGKTYMEQQRYLDAERTFQMLTELKPDFAEAWYDLSILYTRLNNYYDAVNAISQALYYDPGNSEAKEHLKQLTLQSSISITDVNDIKIEDMLL